MFLRVGESECEHLAFLVVRIIFKKTPCLVAVVVNEGCEGQLRTPSFTKCPHGSH